MTDTSLDLVADIGGTNTRLALSANGELRPESVARYANRSHAGLEDILARYLQDQGRPGLRGACLAMAGPIENGTGQLTNLGWKFSVAQLRRATGAEKALIINDLQAQGHALGHLHDAAVSPLCGPPPRAGGHTRLVVGLGTGFNSCTVLETPCGRLVPPAESGHADLPAPAPEDRAFADHLKETRGFASIEDALSGPGLAALHAWHAHQHGGGAPLDAPAVMDAFHSGSPAAGAALRQFARLLGSVCGTLALFSLPHGGIFLCGSVARAVAPALPGLGFEAAFADKGRFSGLISQLALSVITDDSAALAGCAACLSSGMAEQAGFTGC